MDPVEKQLKEMRAVHLDLGEPAKVAPSTSVRECLVKMREAHRKCVLVVDGEKLAGIFTEHDVFNKVALAGGAVDRPVSELMTASPTVLADTESVAKAIHLMHRHGFRHLPIVDSQGRPVRVMSQMDIVLFLAESAADKVLNIPPDPGQVMQTPEGG